MLVDTIAAIATSVGDAGIGIVRISGPASVKIARTVFRNFADEPVAEFPRRKMLYGKVVNPAGGDFLDEALAVYMPLPHSYTCEDVVELQVHGGTRGLRNVLRVVLEAGARLARPGEFTERAFLNGRIDLAQAEAVMDMIRAKTDASLKMASGQLAGELSRRIGALRKELLNFLAGIEAALDYPEEDLPVLDVCRGIQELSAVQEKITALLLSARPGRILKDGLQTVIVGRPNVGKSSLLNAILGSDRALVSEVPGTTRDSIEEYLDLRGIPLRLIDTAGLRETDDRVEQLGIQRTKSSIAAASLILWLVDASEPLSPEDFSIFAALPEVPVIVVVNKTDLAVRLDLDRLRALCREFAIVSVSAKERTGLGELAAAVEKLVFSGAASFSEATLVSNERHVEQLQAAARHLEAALASLAAGMPVDCAVIDIRMALEAMGQIVGVTVSDEVVREIFANFCLGK